MATTTERPASFYRTRQLALFIPLPSMVFLGTLFWFMGGGKGQVAQATPVQAGINTDLPKAAASAINPNKLDAYAAPLDSTRNRDLVGTAGDTVKGKPSASLAALGGPPTAGNKADQAASEAQAQLAALTAAQKATSAPTAATSLTPEEQMRLMQAQHERDLADARTQAKIEALAAAADGGGGGAAPAAARPVAAVKKKPDTRATVVDDDAVVSSLGGRRTKKGRGSAATATGFRGFDSESGTGMDANTLPAVIHEQQIVVSGSLVKMRLTEPAVVNGHQLAANTFIYGKCSLAGERLNITIESLKSGNNIFPATLQVYDVDGLSGLHIPGAIERDASKQAGAEAMGAGDMLTMSTNPGAAAAGVAVNAVKSLGQKKIRLVKVTLKAGYNVMLKVDKE